MGIGPQERLEFVPHDLSDDDWRSAGSQQTSPRGDADRVSASSTALPNALGVERRWRRPSAYSDGRSRPKNGAFGAQVSAVVSLDAIRRDFDRGPFAKDGADCLTYACRVSRDRRLLWRCRRPNYAQSRGLQ